MIDPIISLAFSIYHTPGIYALLIGSGVSRSAGIPTGWEVVLDLVRKLAHVEGEDCGPDPSAWYRGKYGEDPDYGKLLEAIAKSPAERSQLLRNYFEPIDEEREQGLKVPTEAHKAIANIVANGFIRVIVTTNFDRLIEKALEDVGITPIVVSTPDAAEGAMPLTHTKCTVIKAHGDYLDTRIKNTPQELASYDERMNHLLDRVFDEFGLIICGWSAEWDVALYAALERCKTHRFTTYWAVRGGGTGTKAKKLIDLRRAQIIQIVDANTLFREVGEKVFALQEISKPHPLSAKVAVTSLKKYIADERYRIHLFDLVRAETEKLYQELDAKHFPAEGIQITPEEFRKRIRRYEALTEILLALMINGCHWGGREHESIWVKCIERIANPPGQRNGFEIWLSLRLYPALLLLYGGGIASIAADNYQTLTALFTQAMVRQGYVENPLVVHVYAGAVMDRNVWEYLPGVERNSIAVSEYLYKLLRDPLKELLPDEIHYERCFDRFEYILGLVHADLFHKKSGQIWRPAGRFMLRNRYYPQESIMDELEKEIASLGSNWPPLKAGLFDGSIERIRFIKSSFDRT